MSSYKSSPPPPYSERDPSSYPTLLDSLKQSLVTLTMAPSKIELEVLPFDHVEMYGEPDKDTAYSLSGQVAVTLVPPTGWFSDAPPAHESFLLESLVVTFQGQSEFITPQTGHASCRLIEFEQELINDGPITISHHWKQGSSRDPARWFVVFDLKIPGWLPASCSTTFGNLLHEEPEVSYRLSAKAKYREAKSSSQKSWRSACYGYMSLPTSQITSTPGATIKVNRYRRPPLPQFLGETEFPDALFRSAEYSGSVVEGTSRIPMEILSKLRMRACVPEHIPMDSGNFPLLLKVRPDGLSAEERKRLHVNGFFVNARQKEVYRSSMSTEFAKRWPVCPPSEQPPTRPLSSRRNDVQAFECAMGLMATPESSSQASFSLLPIGFSGRIEIDGKDVAKASFADDRFDDESTWIELRVDIPFREILIESQYLSQYADSPVPKLRPSEMGPILSVIHALDIALTCTYDLPEGTSAGVDRVVDELKFSIPLSFVRVPRSGAYEPIAESFTADCDSPLSRTGPAGSVQMQLERVRRGQPSEHALPPYNQLYHKNGNRIEDPTPLPLYAPGGRGPGGLGAPRPTLIQKQTLLHKAVVYPTPPLPRS